MVHYLTAYARPFQDLKKTSLGCLLFVVPFVNVITILFGLGYILRCGKFSLDGKYQLPEWEEWDDLFIEGIVMSLIVMLYLMPALIVGTVAGFAAWTTVMSSSTLNSLPIVISLVWAVFLWAFTFYLVPIGLIRYANTKNFKDAFSLTGVFRVAFTLRYLWAWFLSSVLLLLLLIAGYSLNQILLPTIIGPFLVQGIISFIGGIATMTIIGEAIGSINRK